MRLRQSEFPVRLATTRRDETGDCVNRPRRLVSTAGMREITGHAKHG